MRLFDLHCDTLSECNRQGCSLWQNTLDVDVMRGLQYDAYMQVFAAFVPDTLRGEHARAHALRLLRLAQREADALSALCPVRTSEDMQQAQDTHRCGMLLSVENGAALGGSLSMIDTLADFGVKVITLTWNGANELGNGCMASSADGLTPFGFEVLRRMSAYGIYADVSHLNEAGFWDVAKMYDGAFLATHSLSYAIHPHPRNLTDAQFACIRDSGGLVGLNLCPDHLGEGSFAAFERHLAHFLELDGECTVAVGCDFDGTPLPTDWNGIQVLSALERQLLQDGFGTRICDRLFYKNAYQFFSFL